MVFVFLVAAVIDSVFIDGLADVSDQNRVKFRNVFFTFFIFLILIQALEARLTE